MKQLFLTIIMVNIFYQYIESSEPPQTKLQTSKERDLTVFLNSLSSRIYCLNHKKIFHAFVEQCNAKDLQKLIDHYKKSDRDLQKFINVRNKHRETPLHRAADLCKTRCLQLLIANGACINAQDRAGWTALHFAAATEKRGRKKRNHTVKILCEAGINKKILDRSVQMAREVAFSYGHNDTAHLIELTHKSAEAKSAH